MSGQFIYAAQYDGTVAVYDINNGHNLVKTIPIFTASGADIRGACATVGTHRFYVMYNANSMGHLVCFDLATDKVLWDIVEHSPSVDRGDVTPDGTKIYLPSGEADSTSVNEFVVDAMTGAVISQISIAPLTHDTLCSLDGSKVFMSNKSHDFSLRTASTATNQVTQTLKFSNVLQPFVVNGKNTLVLQDVLNVYGFQYADLTTGTVLGSALYTGTSSTDLRPHGIGFTPNEQEAWGVDRGTGNHYVHVFDMTSLPPRQTHLVTVSHDDPHWVTFDIQGRFAYISGKKLSGETTDIVSTTTYSRIGTLAEEGSLLEVDFNSGAVTQVGSQYGLGRVVNSSSVSAITTSAPATTILHNAASGQAAATVESSDSTDDTLAGSIEQAILSDDGPRLSDVLAKQLPTWVERHPEAAAQFASSLAPGPMRDMILGRVAILWTVQDAPAALAWAQTIENPAERNILVGTVCVQMSESDPHQALAAAEQFNLGNKNAPMFSVIAERWATRDPIAAVSWAAAQPPGEGHDGLISRVALAVSGSVPAEAACLLVDQLPPGNMQDESIISVLDQWARRDPKAAAAWVATFPSALPLRARANARLQELRHYRPGTGTIPADME
jgi:DNA-binding beta-propeller fold protein YncE